MSSFKSSGNIQKKEDGPDRSVSDNQFSSVTLNELAMKARKNTVIYSELAQPRASAVDGKLYGRNDVFLLLVRTNIFS